MSGKAVLEKNSIKVIAQAEGIADLNDFAAEELAHNAEYHLRELVQDAVKFMLHSRREKLLPQDINAALRLKNIEVCFQLYLYFCVFFFFFLFPLNFFSLLLPAFSGSVLTLLTPYLFSLSTSVLFRFPSYLQ